MKKNNLIRSLFAAASVLAMILSVAGCHDVLGGPDIGQIVIESTKEDLVRFDNEEDFRTYIKKLSEAHRARYKAEESGGFEGDMVMAESSVAPSAAPTAGAEGESSESITNTQEQGVDEGGIVKTHGDHLVVLRRGRLFTVRLADKAMAPVSMIDAFPPSGNTGAWYDEMLVHKNTIIVVGYSYGAGGTELGFFDIDAVGKLSHRSTHYMRSNDYYSSRNYASRLMGDKLIFYMPHFLGAQGWGGSDEIVLPGLRARTDKPWNDIIAGTEIYQPIQPTDMPVLHTVVTCDLASRTLSCGAQGIVGPYGRNFYVSRDAVYVWVSDGHSGWDEAPRQEVAEARSVVYRLPLDGSAPGALRVNGVPTDQFSFKESADGHLNVLVRAEGGGEGMWSSEVTDGDVALMRVPIAAFSTKVATVKPVAYKDLPRPTKGWTFQNRFVGDHVLYGSGTGWGYPADQRDDRVFIYPYTVGGDATILSLKHGVDRLEAMGKDAVVIGTDGKDLHFSAVALGAAPTLAGSYIQPNSAQGETRSHGFFFKPGGPDGGTLGLPVRGGSGPGAQQLMYGSASVLYLDVRNLNFAKMGQLAARADKVIDDRCVASCVDWYGNARPIFFRGRVFALLGYELVEGRLGDAGITEIGRTNMIAALLPNRPLSSRF